MHNYRLIVASDLHFFDAQEALAHIADRMVREGICRDSYPAALRAREAEYPTGIVLDGHCVAIPHCDAVHAIEPAVYLIRPAKPVPFAQADEDATVGAELIIALVVTDPKEQLNLLRSLFGWLQQPDFIDMLLAVPEEEMADCFRQHIFASAA